MNSIDDSQQVDSPVIRRAQEPVEGLGRSKELLAQTIAVVSGTGVAAQSRINGELGSRTGDAAAAALISFGSGLMIVAFLAVALPTGRRGLRELRLGLSAGDIPRWFLASGVLGAFLVLVQTFTTPLVGVAVFILGVVVGQAIGGLGVDRAGFGPGGPRPLTTWRVLGTAVIVVAVLIAQSPRFVHQTETAVHAGVGLLLLVAVVQVIAGAGVAVQTAMNGQMAHKAGTPITSTLVNFLGGTIALSLITVIYRASSQRPDWHFPGEWWLYLGGVVGLVFVAAGAVLARVIGVLRTSLSLTAGMLTGGVLLDLVVPTPGTLVTPLTVVGTALTFVGLMIVTMPWRRR